MGRKRQVRRDEKLPAYVSRVPSRNRVTIKHYLGQGKFGRTQYLRDQHNHPLSAEASTQAIFEAYKRIVLVDDVRSLSWLFTQYFKSPRFSSLASATRNNYRIHSDAITSARTKSGRTFGEADLSDITPQVIARYRDKWENDKPVAVAREMQLLSAVFSWAVEQGHLVTNPAKGVRKPSTPPRDRYVSQEEIEAVSAQATGSPYLPILMELAYLCRARVGEILALQTHGNVKRKIPGVVEEGLFIKRTKGSDSEITLWTPRLQQAVCNAKSLHKSVLSPHLLHDSHGSAITYRAVRSAFVRALEKAKVEKFTLHDLKAAGISDHKDQAGGHRSARMRDVYVRVPGKIIATN